MIAWLFAEPQVKGLDKPEGDGYNNAFYPFAWREQAEAEEQGLGYIFYHTPDYQAYRS